MFDRHEHQKTELQQHHSGTGDNVARDKIINIYVNAEDYKRLEKELFELKQNQEKLVQRIRTYPDDAEFQQDLIACNVKIADTQQEIEDFKADVFRLYEQFTRIPLNTERLRRAKEHFDKGEFREADAVLKAEEINAEVTQLQAEKKAATDRLAAIDQSLADRANEFLIKARISLLFPPHEGGSRFRKTKEYFEQALTVARTAEILSAYAHFFYQYNAIRQAESLSGEALKEYRRLSKSDPKAFAPKMADTLNNLAILHQATNEYGSALEEYQEALTIFRGLAQVEPKIFLPAVADNLNNLANLHQATNEYGSALEEYQEALKIRRSLSLSNPEAFLPDVAQSLNNLAVLHYHLHEYDSAVVEYEDALKIRRGFADTEPEVFLPYLAETLDNLAILHAESEEYGPALAEYEEALGIRSRLAEIEPKVFLPDVAQTLNNLAVLHGKMNEYSSAQEAYEQSLKIRRDLAESEPRTFLPYLSDSLNNLATFLQVQKEYDAALEKYKEALEIKRGLAEASPEVFLPGVTFILINLSIFYLQSVPDQAKSVVHAQEARDILIPLCKQAPHLQNYLDKAEQLLKLNNTKPNA